MPCCPPRGLDPKKKVGLHKDPRPHPRQSQSSRILSIASGKALEPSLYTAPMVCLPGSLARALGRQVVLLLHMKRKSSGFGGVPNSREIDTDIILLSKLKRYIAWLCYDNFANRMQLWKPIYIHRPSFLQLPKLVNSHRTLAKNTASPPPNPKKKHLYIHI